jgi:hypothetical protein
MCVNLLSTLIIDDPNVPVTKKMVEILFDGLVSHSIDIRKVLHEETYLWFLSVQ